MNWIKRQLKRFKKWLIALFIGGTVLATTTVNFNGAVLMRDVDLIWMYSQDAKVFNTSDGFLHEGQYALPNDGYSGYHLKNPNGWGYIRVFEEIDKTGMTEVAVVGITYFDVFKDPETGEVKYYEIAEKKYTDYGVKGAGPATKKIQKLSLFSTANAAIAVDPNWAANTYQARNLSGTSITFSSHTVSGTNKVGAVGVSWGGGGSTSVTWDGTTATRMANSQVVVGSDIYRAINPTAGVTNIVYTIGTDSTKEAFEVSFTGADQTQAGVDTCTGSGSSVTSVTCTITTTAANSIVVDAIRLNQNNTLTPGQGTEATDWVVPEAEGTSRQGGHYIQKATAGDQVMSWSWTGAANVDQAAFEILEAAEAGAAGKPRRIIIE